MPKVRRRSTTVPALLLALFVGCGEEPVSEPPPDPPPDPPSKYQIGGEVTGLAGEGLVLRNNGGDDLEVVADGRFVFATALVDGSDYEVSVFAQPTSPSQRCTVTNGRGTLAGADVTDIGIACTTDTFSIGGTVQGLAGTGLVLQNEGGDDLAIAADGPFTFSMPVPSGGTYAVTVATQPTGPSQTCEVVAGSGSVAGDVTDVDVRCTTDTFTVGGTVAGLRGSGLVLQNNGGDDLAVEGTTFTFATALPEGSAFDVTVLARPEGQFCHIRNGQGVLAAASTTAVHLDCVDDFGMLANLRTAPAQSFPDGFVEVGGRIVFVGAQATLGREVYATDGTPAGTALLADTLDGPSQQFPGPQMVFVASDGALFFRGNNGNLWRSATATAAADTGIIVPSATSIMTELAGSLYFVGRLLRSTNGMELLRWDLATGTATEVVEIRPGPVNARAYGFSTLGNTIVFAADDGTSGTELWSSDGTAAGTARLMDIQAGSASSFPNDFVMSSNALYFSAADGVSAGGGRQLWRTDGTAAGTTLAATPPAAINPTDLEDVNGTLFFVASSGGQPMVHRTDGTPAGTRVVGASAGYSAPRSLVAVGPQLFFTAEDAAGGNRELWVTDGTDANTRRIADINPGVDGSFARFGEIPMVRMDRSLVFAADDGTTGTELWRSDGTAMGTARIADLNPGALGSFPSALAVIQGALYFAADDGTTGAEPWMLSSLSGTPVSIADIDPGDRGSSPGDFVTAGGRMMFRASGDAIGNEPWVSDFTAAGTIGFDFDPGLRSSSANSFTSVGNTFLFSMHLGDRMFYACDGTMMGTTPIADVSNAYGFVESTDGHVYFSADNGVDGDELWRSDGTAAGTMMVADIGPGPESSDPQRFAAAPGFVAFGAYAPATDEEPWVTDGTAAGTMLLRDIAPGDEGSLESDDFHSSNGLVFFGADDRTNGTQLWVTDGTPAGTVMLPIGAGGESTGNPNNITAVTGGVMFSASDGTAGSELWFSDGTPTGTIMLDDIVAGPESSNPGGFVSLGALTLFVANDGVAGQELWATDGTQGGAYRVADIMPGPNGASISRMTIAGDKIVFFADDGTPTLSGRDLWVSDGTSAGTYKVRDVVSGVPDFVTISTLASIGPGVVFRGHDGVTGEEPWIYYP